MINQWKALLMERAAEWGVPTAGDWRVLVSNNYQPQYSTLALLWFHNGGQFPRVVTKVFYEPQIPRREFDNLKHVYACAPNSAPRPLHFGLQGKYWMLWMEGVPGLPFRAHGNCDPAILRSVVETVASLHVAVRNGRKPDPDRYHRMISEPLQALAQFGASASVRDGCARMAGRITADWVGTQPVILQHGDLFSGNVLSYRSQWWFVDWESFGIIDLPFYDLLTLLLSLLREDGETPGEWEHVLVKKVPGLVKCYSERLRLPSEDVPLLLPLTLANWFHLQLSDGREQFTMRMYRTIQHYFEHSDLWEKVFLGNRET
jgi:hypothetical protein